LQQRPGISTNTRTRPPSLAGHRLLQPLENAPPSRAPSRRRQRWFATTVPSAAPSTDPDPTKERSLPLPVRSRRCREAARPRRPC
jgi:hypothetical protein